MTTLERIKDILWTNAYDSLPPDDTVKIDIPSKEEHWRFIGYLVGRALHAAREEAGDRWKTSKDYKPSEVAAILDELDSVVSGSAKVSETRTRNARQAGLSESVLRTVEEVLQKG